MENAKHLTLRGLTIKETAALYGITLDTLYHYERIGLVVPSRNPKNGYRLYRENDFFKLNVITEMKAMDFSLGNIQEYFDNHTLSSTFALMNEELTHIDKKMKQLGEAKNGVVDSLQRCARAIAEAQNERMEIVHIPQRECLLISREQVFYSDIPFAFAKAAKQHDIKLGALHDTPCYLVDASIVLPNECFAPKAILLYAQDLPCEADFHLPAGLYVGLTFQGTIQRCPAKYQEMKDYAEKEGYEIAGDPIEFCLIGEYETHMTSEYVTRLEIPVSPRPATC